MNGTSRTNRVIRLGGSFSMLAAMSACLALWGGINLLHPHALLPHASPAAVDEPAPPQPVAAWQKSPQARRALANLLLFWIPLGLSVAASGAGIVTLACSHERDLETSHRALIALILSAIPGCLCTLWYIAFSAPSL
jgi:hypothetical protein